MPGGAQIKWHNLPGNDGILVVTEYTDFEKMILSLYPNSINWVRKHAERVARLSQIILREIVYSNREIFRFSSEAVRISGLIHDIGKCSSPEMIAAVNDPRRDEEVVRRVRRHAAEGVPFIRTVGIHNQILEEVKACPC